MTSVRHSSTVMKRALRVFSLVVVVLAGALAFNVGASQPASALTYANSARWINTPYGQTLSITPTGAAQAIGISAASGVWNNALHLAGTPPYSSAVYASMYEQLQCHLFYKFKTPFNLDTWRPSVSWATELHALCNP